MDIQKALSDGYTSDEIMQELGRRTGMDYKKALSDGYSTDDVLEELNRRDTKKPVDVMKKAFGLSNAPEGNPMAALEVAGTIGSGMIAEPAAGIAGIAKTITSGADEGTKTIQQVREGLTYKPKSEQGQELLQKTGEALEPVSKAMNKVEEYLGDTVYEYTESPTLAALARTSPTLLMEVLGASQLRGGQKAIEAVKNARLGYKTEKAIKNATPSIELLKDTARGIYKEIDEAGILINQQKYSNLINDISKQLTKSGLNEVTTPETYKILMKMINGVDKGSSVSNLDTYRTIAKGIAKSTNEHEAQLGNMILETIDDFFEQPAQQILQTANRTDFVNIGKKYNIARDLWGRSRRSELIGDAFEKARNQASGFENGIRAQFRSILNNKKLTKFFNESELNEMKKVVRGTHTGNLYKLVGKLGISESGNLLGGSIGYGLGLAITGNPIAATIVPAIGVVSKKLAGRLTARNAEFADQVIRAGRDANKIALAYIKNTPTKLRDPAELAQLLMSKDIDFAHLSNVPFTNKAMQIALDYKTAVAGGVAGTEAIKSTNMEQ